MMTTRQSPYVHVLMAVVAVGLLLIAGTGMVQAKHKQCDAELATCNANLGTCNADLSQAQGDLATCNTSLSQSEANLATCEADLAACQANTSAFPATGQTTCYNSAGIVIDCAGTGQDGEIQAGATLSYTDTGNGTIIDDNTGLEWEKKSDDGSINDKDTTYTWENAFAVHVAGLNTANFAGFNDWRLPNVKELQSIVNYEVFNPSVSSAFNTSCDAGDTVTDGSCTAASFYWSSTTSASVSDVAWSVSFGNGLVNSIDKLNSLRVRAVRGGSE